MILISVCLKTDLDKLAFQHVHFAAEQDLLYKCSLKADSCCFFRYPVYYCIYMFVHVGTLNNFVCDCFAHL